MTKLLGEGKTDLLKGFVSKKTNRKFEAFLVVKDGGTAFEFAPRERKGKAKDGKPKEPAPKIDFTGQEAAGQMPEVRRQGLRRPQAVTSARSRRSDKRACKFKIGKEILQQPIDRAQVQKLLAAEQDRSAREIHLQGRQAVPRLPRDGREGQGHLRLPAARRGIGNGWLSVTLQTFTS